MRNLVAEPVEEILGAHLARGNGDEVVVLGKPFAIRLHDGGLDSRDARPDHAQCSSFRGRIQNAATGLGDQRLPVATKILIGLITDNTVIVILDLTVFDRVGEGRAFKANVIGPLDEMLGSRTLRLGNAENLLDSREANFLAYIKENQGTDSSGQLQTGIFRIDGCIPLDTTGYEVVTPDTLIRLASLTELYSASLINGYFEGLQEPLILTAELDGTCRLEDLFLVFGTLLFVIGPTVKSNGGFENHEDIESGLPDLTNGFRDALRLGKRLVDRVSQFLHQDLQIVVHFVPSFPWACLRPGLLNYKMHFRCHEFQGLRLPAHLPRFKPKQRLIRPF